LSFKDTIGGTKITWKTIGKMSFRMKVSTIFDGGMNKILGETYEKSLANIDKTLDFELNSFAVKVNGIVKKLGPLPKTNFYQRNFKSSQKCFHCIS
jgi:hypothetical protein